MNVQSPEIKHRSNIQNWRSTGTLLQNLIVKFDNSKKRVLPPILVSKSVESALRSYESD